MTAIRYGDGDGNPNTEADRTWSSLIATPPFPDYVSGHSTFSGAAATVLVRFYGTDTMAFVTGADATFSSVKIQFCLAGPIGTPAGAQLLDAFFDVQGVFTSPANTQPRVWRALMTPYVAGSPNPNPAGIIESQAVVPGRVSFSVKTKALKRPRGNVLISGTVLVDGKPVGGPRIQIYRVPNLNKAIKTVTTKANGTFAFRKKFTRRTVLFAIAVKVEPLAACPAPALPGVPGGCQTATRSCGAATFFTAKPRTRR